MAERVAPAPAPVGKVRLGLGGRLRAATLRSEPIRGYTLLSPTLGLMILALALPVGLLITFSFWTQVYLDIDRSFTFARYIKFFTNAEFSKFFESWYWISLALAIPLFVPAFPWKRRLGVFLLVVYPAIAFHLIGISIEKAIYPMLLWKSIKISGAVTLATVGLAYPMAYFIAFHVKKNKLIWLILITVPFWTSYLLRVFAWKIILGYNGVFNSGLMSLGLIEEPFMFLLYSQFAVVLTLAHAWAAFAILPIYVSLEKIDRSLLEAATDLGDGPVARFLRVTLPLSMPGVIAASLLVFIPTVGDYVTPNLVGGTTGIMIGNVIQSMFGKANNWPLGAASSVISMIAITALICAFLWLTKRAKRQIA